MHLHSMIIILIGLFILPATFTSKVETIYNKKLDFANVNVGVPEVKWGNWPGIRPIQEALGSCMSLLHRYNNIPLGTQFKRRSAPDGQPQLPGAGKWAIGVLGHYGGNTLNGMEILYCLWEHGYDIGYFQHRHHTPVEEYLYMGDTKRAEVDKYMAGKTWTDVQTFLDDLENGIVSAGGRKMKHTQSPTARQPEPLILSAFNLLDSTTTVTKFVQPHEEYLKLESDTLNTLLKSHPNSDFATVVEQFEIEYKIQLPTRAKLDTLYYEEAKLKLVDGKDVVVELDSMFGTGIEGPSIHPKAYCGFQFMRESQKQTRQGQKEDGDKIEIAGVDGASGQSFWSKTPDLTRLSPSEQMIFQKNASAQKLLIPLPNVSLAVNQFDPNMPDELKTGTGTVHYLTMPKSLESLAPLAPGNPTYILDIAGECIVGGCETDSSFPPNPFVDLNTIRTGFEAMTVTAIAPAA